MTDDKLEPRMHPDQSTWRRDVKDPAVHPSLESSNSFNLSSVICDLSSRDARSALLAILFVGAIGVLLVFLFPGSPEQDVDYHFLMARTAWVDHFYFVDVWARPLFTAIFAPFALWGFTASRFFALAVSLAVAWQTYRLACDLGMQRPWLAILFLVGQPAVFVLFSNLFTELPFALVFVTALRCDFCSRRKLGMLIASFLPLARPEGVFLCLLWGFWILLRPDQKETGLPIHRRLATRLPSTLILGTGVLCWWLAALVITKDPLFILHNWPATWHQDMYARGTYFSYAQRAQKFIGLAFLLPFLLGLLGGFRSRHWALISSSFLLFFLLHSIFLKYGLFGEAGFPRYMASVSPAIALLTLEGWNRFFSIKILRPISAVSAVVVLALSFVQGSQFLDSMIWGRDAIAINQMADWLKQRDRSIPGLIWSNGHMCTALGRNMKNSPPAKDRENLLLLLQKAPPGTIVFWDSEIGPNWFGMTSDGIEQRGYQLLLKRRYNLEPVIYSAGRFSWVPWMDQMLSVSSRNIELSLLEKK
jgi:hypothetical protein